MYVFVLCFFGLFLQKNGNILHSLLYFTVFHQFDDVCMQPGMWSKSYEITGVRQDFITSALTQLMNCTNQELSEMYTKVQFFHECLQTRRVCVRGMEPVTIQTSWVRTDVMIYTNKTISMFIHNPGFFLKMSLYCRSFLNVCCINKVLFPSRSIRRSI